MWNKGRFQQKNTREGWKLGEEAWRSYREMQAGIAKEEEEKEDDDNFFLIMWNVNQWTNVAKA